MADWSTNVLSTAAHTIQEEYDNETERDYALRRKVDILSSGRARVKETAMGETRIKRLDWILENGFSWKRHHFERMFHAKCVTALAKTMMGPDWSTMGAEIAAERGWDHISKFVAAMAPRRFGKSVSAAKLVAALAEVLIEFPEGLEFTTYPIAVFSTGRRASDALSAYVEGFLQERGMAKYFIKKNSEKIWLQREDKKMTVQMIFLPSNPDK